MSTQDRFLFSNAHLKLHAKILASYNRFLCKVSEKNWKILQNQFDYILTSATTPKLASDKIAFYLEQLKQLETTDERPLYLQFDPQIAFMFLVEYDELKRIIQSLLSETMETENIQNEKENQKRIQAQQTRISLFTPRKSPNSNTIDTTHTTNTSTNITPLFSKQPFQTPKNDASIFILSPNEIQKQQTSFSSTKPSPSSQFSNLTDTLTNIESMKSSRKEIQYLLHKEQERAVQAKKLHDNVSSSNVLMTSIQNLLETIDQSVLHAHFQSTDSNDSFSIEKQPQQQPLSIQEINEARESLKKIASYLGELDFGVSEFVRTCLERREIILDVRATEIFVSKSQQQKELEMEIVGAKKRKLSEEVSFHNWMKFVLQSKSMSDLMTFISNPLQHLIGEDVEQNQLNERNEMNTNTTTTTTTTTTTNTTNKRKRED